jgi:rsbT antagonist protein RsbS
VSADDTVLNRIPLQVMQNCVVASVQVDLGPAVLRAFQQDLLELLHASGAGTTILDLSGVQVMDRAEFESLRRSLAMAALLGARCLVCGLQPGVVASLVELGVDFEGLDAALNLDDAFRRMEVVDGPDAGADDSLAEQEGLINARDDQGTTGHDNVDQGATNIDSW